MRIGRSRSSKVVDFGTNGKGVCDFLLVINSNFVISCTVSEIRRVIGWKLRIFPTHPCLTPLFRENPSEFLDETYRTKTRGMGLKYGENRMILSSAVFAWITRVADGQTDRRNCDSICAQWHIICCRAQKTQSVAMLLYGNVAPAVWTLATRQSDRTSATWLMEFLPVNSENACWFSANCDPSLACFVNYVRCRQQLS